MASIATPPKLQFFDANGNPLAGGKLYSYAAGTTTPLATYTDAGGGTPNSNPVVLDARGEANVWFGTSQYKLKLTDADDVEIYTVDNLNGADAATLAVLAASSGSSLIGYINSGTGAVARTVQARLRDFVSVKDFGALGNGVNDDTTAIQAALDAHSFVYFPAGNYLVSNSLKMNDGNFVQGAGRGISSTTGSKITSSYNGAIFIGKSVTPASGTNVRRYNGGGRDLWLYGPGKASGASIGLDMRGCTMFKWYDIRIQNINSGVVTGSGYSSYYNEFYGVDIDAVEYGYYQTALGNENLVVGGRVNDCTTGTYDSDNSHNKYIGLAIEVFTNGHKTASPATQYIQYSNSRLENVPTTGTGFVIDSTAQDTTIIAPAMIGLTTDISGTGVRTNIIATENWTIASGTRIKKHLRVNVTQDVASLAAGAVRQETFTVSGVLAGDSIFVTFPSSWPNIVAGPVINGGTDTVYIQLYNPTAGAIDPASATFTFDIWRH